MSEKSSQPREIDWGQIIETAMTMPGSVGNVYTRFYPYSYANQAYLWMQGAREPVAKLKLWNALGRTVITGSKAYEVFAPVFARKDKNDPDEEPVIVNYKPVKSAFTYSQTEGKEPPPVQIPGWDLDTALQKLNITRVPFRKNDGNIQGYAKGRDIAINPFAKYPAKTTLHEIAHIALSHTLQDQIAEYEQHRGIFEFEAESTAYLSLNELGQIDEEQASVSRAYIQGWMSGERPPDKSIRKVFSTVDKILKAGRLAIDLSLAP